MTETDESASGKSRLYYCPPCGDHYAGDCCPHCGERGVLA